MPMPVSTRSGGKASVMQLCMCRLAGIAFDGTKRASADNAIAMTTAQGCLHPAHALVLRGTPKHIGVSVAWRETV